MKFVYPSEGTVSREATTVARTWRPLSRPVRELLVIAVAVATIVGVLWGIGASAIAGLENRLIDRMDISHRELSAQIEVLERRQGGLLAGQGALPELSAQVDGLERSMAEGFKQSYQRMDRIEGRMDRMDGRMDRIEGRMDGRMDRIESDIDQIKSDIDAIEKHLIRIGSPTEREATPATNVPALAAPDRQVISTGQFESDASSPIPLSGQR